MNETERILTMLHDEADWNEARAESEHSDSPDDDRLLKHWQSAMGIREALWEALLVWRVFGYK